MQVAVLGGGLSGLSAAYHLRRALPAASVTVLEASGRVGGWLWTHKQDGAVFERGCRGLRPSGNGSRALEVIEDLGLEAQAVVADKAAGSRFVYLNGKLEELPSSFLGIFSSPLTAGLFPGMLRDLSGAFSRPSALLDQQDGADGDESLHDFFTRRFSSTVAERLIDPMVSGIYAGDTRQLSVRSVFPSLKAMEEEAGSVLVGAMRQAVSGGSTTSVPTQEASEFVKRARKAASVSFADGIQVLPDALHSWLQADEKSEVVLDTAVTGLSPVDGGVVVSTQDASGAASTSKFDAVISTLPAPTLSGALPESCAASSTALAAIPFANVAVVSMAFDGDVLPYSGFGYLVPSTQKQGILGCVWDSCTFPAQGNPGETRLTVMAGGAHNPDIVHSTPQQLEDLARTALGAHLNITDAPKTVVSGAHAACIPQYVVGHSSTVSTVETQLGSAFGGRLFATGNSLHGIGSSDCVANGAKAADAIAAVL